MSVQLAFAWDRDGDAYVVSLTEPQLAGALVALRLPAKVVEPIVLTAVGVQLELRAGGRIVAYSDRAEATDIVARSLNELMAEALEVLSPTDDFDELAELQARLECILSTVIEARARLDQAPSDD